MIFCHTNLLQTYSFYLFLFIWVIFQSMIHVLISQHVMVFTAWNYRSSALNLSTYYANDKKTLRIDIARSQFRKLKFLATLRRFAFIRLMCDFRTFILCDTLLTMLKSTLSYTEFSIMSSHCKLLIGTHFYRPPKISENHFDDN